jgi:acyl-CoA thioesterase-1
MIRKNLDAMITRLQTAGIQVVLAGMRIPPNYGTEYTQGFHQIYVDLASEHHLVLIPFFLENVAGIPELNLEDGIHPTPEGYRIIAKQVLQVIEPLLGLSSPQRHSAAEPQPRIRCFRLAA